MTNNPLVRLECVRCGQWRDYEKGTAPIRCPECHEPYPRDNYETWDWDTDDEDLEDDDD